MTETSQTEAAHPEAGAGKTAFLFPGQGSQKVGMGKAIYDVCPEVRALFAKADEVLDEPLTEMMFEGPEEALTLTANAQPALLTVSTAYDLLLKRRGVHADYVAGHSLGEYSALVSAGALSFEDALRSVRARGQLMQQAVPEGLGAMAAITRLELEKIRECCRQASHGELCAPANLNSPEQTVISGHAGAVARACELCKNAGARRAIQLKVSAPFHCRLMSEVQPRLRRVLEFFPFSAPTVPVITNVEAAPNDDPARIVDLLVTQVTSTVRWTESIQKLVELGVTRVIEVGSGKVLCGLARQIDKSLTAIPLDDPDGFSQIIGEL